MSEHRHATALPASVHAAELQTIKARRKAAGLDVAGVDSQLADDPVASPSEDSTDEAEALSAVDGAPRTPSTQRGLIGLAISGGGIRSSTFSLGVIQALAERGVFKSFDYLSTVSGGGYTGSMISSLLNRPPKPDEPFPLDKPEGVEEPPALRHLRNGSNYLSPGGLLNALRLPAVVVRGLLLNALLILPFLMFAVVGTEWLHEKQTIGRAVAWTEGGFASLPFLTALLIVVGYLLLSRADAGDLKRRNLKELGLAVALLVLGGVLFAIPFLHLIELAMETPYASLKGYVQSNMRGQVWLVAGGIFLGAYILVKATEKLDAAKKLQAVMSKALLYGVAIAGPGLFIGFYLLLLVSQVDSPFMHGSYGELADTAGSSEQRMSLSSALLVQLDSKGIVYPRDTILAGRDTTITMPVIVAARYCPGSPGAWQLSKINGVEGSVPEDQCGWADEDVQARSAALSDTTLASIRLRATPWSKNYTYEVWGAQLHLGGAKSSTTLFGDGTFLLIAVLLLIGNTVFLNVNMSSLHRFYRDRLSQLYIFGLGDRGSTESNDAQTLTGLNHPGLNQTGSVAPYHIVNTTLNLQGDRVESTRGRSSDFFMFSKHYCGSPHTGYCRTEALEAVDPRANLGTAMAISAAAAAPNMGSATNKSMVFIMTLLNFRLGYWLPNPRWVNKVANREKRAIPFWTFRPGTLRLADEALGRLTSESSMVNLSDGGHLENLATYELLRRRCRFIVIIDGEADPELTFHGLVTLMRLAKIDLGVTIRMDPGELERIHWNKESNTTDRHFAFGEIDYGTGERGLLVYVKTSITGDENPYVKRYRAENPTFPHETTADQFFDEIQFEAYRSLGHHVGHDVANELIGQEEAAKPTPVLLSFIEDRIAKYSEDATPQDEATIV